MRRRPTRSTRTYTLCPYTTLFRSRPAALPIRRSRPKRSARPVRPLRPPTASATTRTVAWKSLTVRVRACKTGFHSRQGLDEKEGRHRKVPPFLCSSYKPVWGGDGRPSARRRFGRGEGARIRSGRASSREKEWQNG